MLHPPHQLEDACSFSRQNCAVRLTRKMVFWTNTCRRPLGIFLLACLLSSAAGFLAPCPIAPQIPTSRGGMTVSRSAAVGLRCEVSSEQHSGPLDQWALKGRRAALLLLIGGAQAASAQGLFGGGSDKEATNIAAKLEGSQLQQVPQDLSTVRDIEYPAWLEGQWAVEAVMTSWKAPMGNKFLGGITPEVNEASAREAAAQVGSTVKYNIRFVQSKDGKIVEDRPFNTQQRLDAYAGRSIVRRVEYVPLDRGGKTRDLNTLTYFKGGLVGKVFSTRRRFAGAEGGSVFICDEGKRELYGRKCDITVERICPPPITTDLEVVSKYQLMDDGTVEAAVRIAGFLNPNDKLFFEATQKAVTISDYKLKCTKTAVTAPEAAAAAAARRST